MSVLILCYHNVNKKAEITPDVFLAHAEKLCGLQYKAVSMDDVYCYVRGTMHLPEKSVHLTFDDGYSDFYSEAFPIIKEYSLKATAFLITSRVGLMGYMSWEHIRQIQEAGNVDFGSHSHTHARYFLAEPDSEELYKDLIISKRLISEHLHKEPVHFCYPYGQYDDRYVRIVKEAGFVTGLTLDYGVNCKDMNPYLLKRVEPDSSDNWLGLSG